MPVNPKYLAKFEYGSIYHIYNKTNNRELLFRSDENNFHFLNLFRNYVSPFVETYAWNLLPNHFHFLVRIRQETEIMGFINNLLPENQTKSEKLYLLDGNINNLIQMEFKRFFTAYAMSFNNFYKRKGNLFYRTFRRVKIGKDHQFTLAIIYIHANAQKHKLVRQFDKYRWTSFHILISEKPTILLRDEILQWFGGKDMFLKTQYALTEYYYCFENSIEVEEDDSL
ncbi:hypothetical protein BH11BAC4_BH11BAC4_10980 [soil metagenome]